MSVMSADRLYVPAYRLRGAPEAIAWWCPFCGAPHSHGAAGGDGNRGAHCISPVSPGYRGGYTLIECGSVASDRFLPRTTRRECLELSARLACVA